LQLDHVLARGLGGQVREVEVVELALSDHRAVVVELA
jgi:endonuclease/exonuclease/phosphatase (EEP) superfamily protein YafD